MRQQKNRGGRPRKSSDQRQEEYLDVRLRTVEKRAFQEAATLAGLSLAAWVRERLRWAATKELQSANIKVAFLEDISTE